MGFCSVLAGRWGAGQAADLCGVRPWAERLEPKLAGWGIRRQWWGFLLSSSLAYLKHTAK